MAEPVKCCKNCHFLAVRPDRDGKVRVRTGVIYACTVPKPTFEVPPSWGLTLYSQRVQPTQGRFCPAFKPKEKQ